MMKSFPLIQKSLSSPKKFYRLLTLILTISIIMIAVLSDFLYCVYYGNYCTSDFGSYHLVIHGIMDDTILDNYRFQEIMKVEETTIQAGENDYKLFYVPEGFFDFTEYDLIMGTEPQKRDEMVTSMELLYRLGIPENEMIGSRISFDGQEFTITGCYERNQVIWDPGEKESVFSGNPQDCATAYIRMKSYSKAESFYDASRVNNRCDRYVYMETNLQKYSIWANAIVFLSTVGFVLFILLIALCVIYHYITTMILREQMKNISALHMVGISNKHIFIAIGKNLCLSIGKSMLYALPFCGLFNIAYVFFYHNAEDFSVPVLLGYAFLVLLIVLCILCVFFLGITIFTLYRKSKNLNFETANNTENIKLKYRTLTKRIHNFFIVKRHIALSKGTSILIFTCISLLMIATCSIYLGLNMQTEEEKIFPDCDYIVRINYDEARLEAEKMEAFMDSLQELNSTELEINTYCAYSTEISVDKKAITPKWEKSFNDMDFVIAMHNNIITEVEIPIVFLGIDQEEIDQLYRENIISTNTLADGTALLFSYPQTKDYAGVYPEYIKEVTIRSQTLNTIAIEGSYPLFTTEVENAIILVANLDTYRLASKHQFPSYLFATLNGFNEKEFITMCKGKESVTVTNKKITDTYETNSSISVLIHEVILFCMVVFIAVIYLIIIMIQADVRKKEYATLYALGIPKKDIQRMITYELFFTLFVSWIAGTVASFITIQYWIMKYSNMIDYSFQSPYAPIIICTLLLIFIFGVGIWIIRKQLENTCKINRIS